MGFLPIVMGGRTDRQTNRQTDKDRKREKKTQAERQTDRQTDRDVLPPFSVSVFGIPRSWLWKLSSKKRKETLDNNHFSVTPWIWYNKSNHCLLKSQFWRSHFEPHTSSSRWLRLDTKITHGRHLSEIQDVVTKPISWMSVIRGSYEQKKTSWYLLEAVLRYLLYVKRKTRSKRSVNYEKTVNGLNPGDVS